MTATYTNAIERSNGAGRGVKDAWHWNPGSEAPAFAPHEIARAVERVRETLYLVRQSGTGALGVAFHGTLLSGTNSGPGALPIAGTLPPLYPEWLGDAGFLRRHNLRYPYVAGEMATGIATPAMVIAAARAGFMGFFGAAGLSPERIEASLAEIQSALAGCPTGWGSNLIHSPHSSQDEDAIVSLYLRRGVTRMSASAFMALTPAVVRYAATGLRQLPNGSIERRNSVFAKVSRPEVASAFLSPAPARLLDGLVRQGLLTLEEAGLAAKLPVAEDITVEADSGGHTDNRPLTALLPTVLAERDRVAARYGYEHAIRVGAAGGLGTPTSVAAAFALGAAYVMTGSINQAAVESGTSSAVKKMLATAELVDCAMAPAGDMFEMGVKVQVLKRGTLFAARANKLYQVYLEYAGLDAIPGKLAQQLEKEIFRASFAEIWSICQEYWTKRDAVQVTRCENDPKHKMALVFRWYLGQAGRWAVLGDPHRAMDYQIWCGPAMGAFNSWTAGSFLADPSRRTVEQIARNLLEGAAAATRAQQLRTFGVPVPPSGFTFRPRPLA